MSPSDVVGQHNNIENISFNAALLQSSCYFMGIHTSDKIYTYSGNYISPSDIQTLEFEDLESPNISLLGKLENITFCRSLVEFLPIKSDCVL